MQLGIRLLIIQLKYLNELIMSESILEIHKLDQQATFSVGTLNAHSLKSKFTAPYMQLFTDIFSFLLIYFLHFLIRFKSGYFGSVMSPDFYLTILSSLILTSYWIILFWLSGLYKDWYVRSPFDEFFSIVKVSLFGTFLIFFIVFLDSISSRLLFLIYLAVFIIITSIGRLIARKLQKRLRASNIIAIPIVIIGTTNEVKELILKINGSKEWGYIAIGIILVSENEVVKWYENGSNDVRDIKLLGTSDNLSEILKQTNPKEVLIAIDKPEHELLLSISSLCAERKILIKIVPDLYDFFTGQARAFHLYAIPLIEINTQLLKPWQYLTKRTIDFIISFIILLTGIPIWILLALMIKFDSKGSIFYKQVRVGKDERNFVTYKFRTMIRNAEKHGPQWALVNDSRVTRVGRFLRKTHLDEVPQFWNVLRGEMSIVGPRPERPIFVEKFSKLIPYYKRRLVVRPGITGWYQVRHYAYVESKEEIENRLKADFYYIENMSFILDFEILVRTLLHMIRGRGQA